MKPFITNPCVCKESSSAMATPIQPQSSKPAAATRPAEQQGLNCPRCDSPNTKFCYYNNYSLTQPRHYCKTCRRYWTRGGALRNVPIGGGCRKSKKSKSARSVSSSASSSASLPLPPQLDPLAGFHNMLPYGYAYDERLSIESLSSINQDMHWKLQQQRLQAMMAPSGQPDQVDKAASDAATAWFLQTPYGMAPNAGTATAANTNTGMYASGDWNVGIPSWSDVHQFTTALP